MRRMPLLLAIPVAALIASRCTGVMLPLGIIKRSTRRSGRHSRADPQARGGTCTDRGIVPMLGQILAQSELRACFEAKGRMRSYLAAAPIYVVVLLYPGLLGAPTPAAGALEANAGYCRAASCRIAIMRSATSWIVVPTGNWISCAGSSRQEPLRCLR
jgi:hypothetical protein